jgi:H+/Cl- antiporter ClcA
MGDVCVEPIAGDSRGRGGPIGARGDVTEDVDDTDDTAPWVAVWRAALDRWATIVVEQLRWLVLGGMSGVLAGLASWVFLEGLDRVTLYRLEHGWIVWFLPVAGLAIGLAYHLLGGRAAEGNDLLIDEIHDPTDWVPRRMAPLVLVGTWVTHLFGGSAGREGVAMQMSGSLTDSMSRVLRLGPEDRRILLIAALGGGFGAVFGVPLAGAVFGLEVQSVGRIRYDALVPSMAASLIGDLVVHGLGYHHAAQPTFPSSIDGELWVKVALAGACFGLVATLFAATTHCVKALLRRRIAWPPLRPVLGGAMVLVLMVIFGRQYLGLSLPLAGAAVGGASVATGAFAVKLVFTAVTLGSGFPGGEVTPLQVIGATLGATLATLLHADPSLLAAVGFVAVFAGASNTPLACTIMGAELFGSGAIVPMAIGCVMAYVFSSHQGIYTSQRVAVAKPGRRP